LRRGECAINLARELLLMAVFQNMRKLMRSENARGFEPMGCWFWR